MFVHRGGVDVRDPVFLHAVVVEGVLDGARQVGEVVVEVGAHIRSAVLVPRHRLVETQSGSGGTDKGHIVGIEVVGVAVNV